MIVKLDQPPSWPIESAWYGVRVRSNFEHVTAASLGAMGFDQFLPLTRARRRWSDRVKYVDQPLFPGYVFCRFGASSRIQVLGAPGVVNVVAFGSRPAPIPDEEINTIRTMVNSSRPVCPYPLLRPGQKVRLRRGPLSGAEGVVVEDKKQFRLVASIPLLQRSVAVEIDREWISPIA